MRPVRVLFLVVASAAALLAAGAVPAGAATPVRPLDGIGPLKLGMTRTAALATGWLSNRSPGCELAGPPRPITYRLHGANAPAGLRGTADFRRGRLRNLSFTRGVRTGRGVTVGRTTTSRMVATHRRAGFGALARFDSVFRGTFVTVRRNGRQVLGGFTSGSVLEILAIPVVPVCE